MNNKLDRKNFVWNTIGSTFSSFTSLIFMIILTRINGTAQSGVFTFCFSLACLLQIVGTYSGRIYQVSNKDKNITDSDFIYSRFLTTSAMLIISVNYSIIKGYDLEKYIILLLLVLYKIIEAISDIYHGVIQKNGFLYKVGISLFFKAVLGVLFFMIIDLITNNVIFSLIGLLLVNIIIFIFYDYLNFKKMNYKKTNFSFSNIIKILKSGFFVFYFTILIQYVINAPKFAIDNLLSNDIQAIYGIIVMPATLLLLCSQFFTHPVIIKINNYTLKKDYKNLRKISFKISFCIILIGVLALLVAYLFGIPFLNFVYNIKLNNYLKELLIIIVGAIFFGVCCFISNVLIVLEKNFSQAILYTIIAIFSKALASYLVFKDGILGACLTYLITMFVLFIIYIILFLLYTKNNGGLNEKESFCYNSSL